MKKGFHCSEQTSQFSTQTRMLRTAAALGAAVVVGRSAARHQHQRIHAESATAAPATPKKQLKPIYDPAPPKDVDADVDADEQQQQQYVYLVNDEVPVTSPVRMLRETVQTVYGIVKVCRRPRRTHRLTCATKTGTGGDCAGVGDHGQGHTRAGL